MMNKQLNSIANFPTLDSNNYYQTERTYQAYQIFKLVFF